MKNIKYREDGTPVIVVPFKMRHLGRKQTIVLNSESRTLDDIAKEPLPRAVILAHQYAEMLESGKFSSQRFAWKECRNLRYRQQC